MAERAIDPSREASWDSLAREEPEIIVLALCGVDLPRTFAEWGAWRPPEDLALTPAWKQARCGGNRWPAYVSRPGPRLIDGVEILSAIFSGRADPRAVRLPLTPAWELERAPL